MAPHSKTKKQRQRQRERDHEEREGGNNIELEEATQGIEELEAVASAIVTGRRAASIQAPFRVVV